MGCLGTYEGGQSAFNIYHRGYVIHQYSSNQNRNTVQPRQNVVVQLPDQKIFEFDPNFFNNCYNIEKVAFPDGTYEGQLSEGKPNGKGIFYYNNGDIYQGEFKEGLRHGKGIIKYSNGKIYNGDWENGIMEGKGFMKYTEAIYEGEWKNGKNEGKGKITIFLEEGKCDIYEGEWKNGVKNGYGKYKFHDGKEYVGDFVNNQLDGF